MLSALSCGATKEVPALYLLRVLSSSPAPFTDALISDLNLCHQLVGTQKESPFFRTALEAEMFRPVFSAQADLRSEGISSLLLQALLLS